MRFIARFIGFVASLLAARPTTVHDAVADLEAVIVKADLAAKQHAADAAAHSDAAAASQANATAASADADRTTRVGDKLRDLLG